MLLTSPVDEQLPDDGVQSTYENGQDIRDRAFAFACRVVKFSQKIYDAGGVGRMLVPQLVNCSTSVPSMLEEARAAESRRDFISKCCIALKECRESWTRLRVCESCRIGPVAAASACGGEQLTDVHSHASLAVVEDPSTNS